MKNLCEKCFNKEKKQEEFDRSIDLNLSNHVVKRDKNLAMLDSFMEKMQYTCILNILPFLIPLGQDSCVATLASKHNALGRKEGVLILPRGRARGMGYWGINWASLPLLSMGPPVRVPWACVLQQWGP